MIRIVYASTAVALFNNEEMVLLLTKIRPKNTAAQITGILLYKDGNFMQVLEGPDDAVATLLAKIKQDRRHHNMMILLREKTQERLFPDWSMAFYDFATGAHENLEGFSPFLTNELTAESLVGQSGRIHRLLNAFKQIVR